MMTKYNSELYRQKYYIEVECPDCGKKRDVSKYNVKFGKCTRCKPCSWKRHGEDFRGKNNWNWQGGQTFDSHGYLIVKIYPDSPYFNMHMNKYRVLKHRLVMAQHLGRCLKTNEMVHHLNGIKDDNRIENLALTNRKDHPKNTFVKLLQERIRILEGK